MTGAHRNYSMPVTFTFGADAYSAGTRHPPHRHDSMHMSLVLSGNVAETVGSRTEFAGALSVVTKDAGVVHADDFGATGARLARLSLPSGTLGALVDDPSRSSGWRWTHHAAVARPFLRLACRARAGESSFDSDDADLVDLTLNWVTNKAVLDRLFVQNPAELFGFPALRD